MGIAERHPDPGGKTMRPRHPVSIALIVLMILGSIGAAWVALDYERSRAQQRAEQATQAGAAVLDGTFRSAETALIDAAAFHVSSEEVTTSEFARYANRVLGTVALVSIGRLERVTAAERADFEQRTGRPIIERGPDRELIPAPERAVYYPSVHVESELRPKAPVGANVAADPRRRAVIERAVVTGGASLTGVVPLIGTGLPGLILFQAGYRDGDLPATPAQRGNELLGVSAGSFAVELLLEPMLAAAPSDVALDVRSGETDLTPGTSVADADAVASVEFGGQTFEVVATRPAPSLALPLAILLGGLALSGLATALLIVLARRDSAQRRAVEEATRDLVVSRESHRALVENSPDVISRFSPDLRCLYISPNVEAGTGLGPDAYVGRLLGEMPLGPGMEPVWRRGLTEVLDTRAAAQFEFAFEVAGESRQFEVRLQPEFAPDGSVASILTSTRDVTGQVAAEAALRSSEERHRSLIAVMPNGVVLQAEGGEIVDCNPAAEEILGLTRDQMTGRDSVDPRWHAIREDGSPLPGGEHPAMVTPATGRPMRDVLMGVHRADGSLVWISTSTEPFMLDGRRAVVASFADVTARLEAEREQASLRRLATLVASEADPRSVFDSMAEEAGLATSATAAAVVRFDDGHSTARTMGAWSGDAAVSPAWGGLFDIDDTTVVGRVALSGDARRLEDPTCSHQCEILVPGTTVSSVVATPIVVNGMLWGALAVASTGERPFPASTEGRLGRLAEIATLAIMSSDARAQLATLASTDHLTGLWNRRAFQERLAVELDRARRLGRRLGLVIMDIDHFKLVNDTHGHPVGDRVLVEFARRLTGVVRAGEIVARVGGEEFAWILPEMSGPESVLAAERLRRAIMAEPFPGVGRLTVSAGVCGLDDAGADADLFRLADVALYWAKAQGRNRVFRYSSETIELLPADEQERRLERARAFASVQALARAVDAKDALTQRHSERVAEIARRLALAVGWTREEAGRLHQAGLVHDVGKIAIPDAILLKPGGLTEQEYRRVQEHVTIGETMLRDALAPDQMSWVRSHHERLDGAGYPDGLVGEDIPQGARLLGLADAWDAMTVARAHAAPRTIPDARAECRRLAGTQFDPEAVEALEGMLDADERAGGTVSEPGGVEVPGI
jgi:diguanylate cyclase (GGDEF)-like protein/PAS domain S-box-containing protein